MPSGYEQSPDYGGPEPNLKLIGLVLLLIVIAVAWWNWS
jgi:hypothetical protein